MNAHNVFAALVVLGGIGCSAGSATSEPTGEANQELGAWLFSPPNFHDGDAVGTWVPVDPEHFEGGDAHKKTVVFSKEGANRTYRLSDTADACSGECPQNGTWLVENNLVVSAFRGTYVTTRSTVVSGNEKSLFVWRMASGEIRLVDLDSCDWLRLTCHNTWARTPALTSDDL